MLKEEKRVGGGGQGGLFQNQPGLETLSTVL